MMDVLPLYGFPPESQNIEEKVPIVLRGHFVWLMPMKYRQNITKVSVYIQIFLSSDGPRHSVVRAP